MFQLYPGKIVLPRQVYIELCNPSVPHLKRGVDHSYLRGRLSTREIEVNTAEYYIYHKLAIAPPRGVKRLGKGEAAAIALAKAYNGVLASNNLKDVVVYVEKYKLQHITTSKILMAALEMGYINRYDGNDIWKNMLARKRTLPARTFTDYLRMERKGGQGDRTFVPPLFDN